MANREAQPVAYLNKFSGVCMTLEQQPNAADDVAVYSPLYTAPPAPANAVAWEMRYWSDGYNIWGDWERITAEQHAEMSVKYATDNDYEFRVLYDAPPAPQSTNAADWGINMQTGTPILVYKNCSVIESEQAHYVLSLINSVAMLAQPVSSGYKLVPAEATEDMIAAAMNCDDVSFNADETFCVNFGNIYAAMLAAAPESGK
ncbi:hypothetical protein [Serratia marcescens]|uniref:hypothetical protein n=1 Tax=Serratia marcescens TaxID=615 RepID=UPI003F7FCF8E